MPDSQRFPYTVSDGSWGEASLMPYLPLTLRSEKRSVSVSALVDSGATVSVLPLSIGLQLGLTWEEQATSLTLGGSLAALEAKGIVLIGEVHPFPSVKLVFAWVKSDDMPVLLGQTNFLLARQTDGAAVQLPPEQANTPSLWRAYNFFMEFNVYFYRAHQMFEVQPK